MTDGEFTGRTALVTGGSRGIGRAICLGLARGGARVAVNYVSDAKAAEAVVAAMEAEGGGGVAVPGDVSDPDQVAAMVRATEEALGPIDLLVCNAGVISANVSRREDFENWRRVMAVNVDGTYLPVMAVKDGMIERGFGRIVCLASIAGLRPRPQGITYATSKAAVIGFVRSAAAAFAPAIRMNAIAPGLIETDMTDPMDETRRAELIAATPMKRIGQPEEIAEMALFLLSERSSFTSGQTLVASGGRVTVP